MKLSLKILICLLLLSLTGACSHSTFNRFSSGSFNHPNFALDNRDYIGNSTIIGMQFHLSQHTLINFNIKSIADFIQPSDFKQNNKLSPEEIKTQPWAFCEISF